MSSRKVRTIIVFENIFRRQSTKDNGHTLPSPPHQREDREPSTENEAELYEASDEVEFSSEQGTGKLLLFDYLFFARISK